MSTPPDAFQVSAAAAEVYEARFVPALFAKWAPHLVEAASVTPGHRVLDVACGTGVVAREAADRLRGDGTVVGVDINDGMLAVAERLRPDLEWRQADAAQLPFTDGSFDVVLCQAALMFFPQPERALSEMARVVDAAGTVAIHVWSSLPAQTGWAPFYEVVRLHGGTAAIDLISTYWSRGDLGELEALCAASGLRVDRVRTRQETATFDSVDDFVATEVDGTPLREQISDATYDAIVADARVALARFGTPGGPVEVPIEGHVITARPTVNLG